MKVEIFKCKTCGDVYAISRYPDCQTSISWQKEKLKQLKNGNTDFDVMEYKENMLGGFEVNKCCGKKAK